MHRWPLFSVQVLRPLETQGNHVSPAWVADTAVHNRAISSTAVPEQKSPETED